MIKKALVTGAAGFIGSHLCDELLKRHYEVFAIDDLSTGRKKNIEHLIKKINFYEGSITNDDLLSEVFKDSNIDTVFHVAAIPSVLRSIEKPESSHEVNIDGTFKLLSASSKNKVRRFVYSASSSAYGQQKGEFKTENLPPDPLSPYALQKWVGEKYSHFFTEFFNLETVALRYFNVFGPRQNPFSQYSAVIPLFIKAALQSTPAVIHGDGLQARDFTYVANVVHANMQAMLSPSETCGQTYNVALGESTDLLTLISMIEEITGKKIKREHVEDRLGDIRYSKADTHKAQEKLQYKPLISLQEGLQKTVDFIKTNEEL